MLGDPIELGRVFANLFENARRYGRVVRDDAAPRCRSASCRPARGSSSRCATAAPACRPRSSTQLTTPFFRGDTARTSATGAGLGLAVVKKSIQRMGGSLEMTNGAEGGLVAHVRLRRVEAT